MKPLFDLPPLAADDYGRLKADIAQRGVLLPIQVLPDGRIIDGVHRLKACDELGIDAPKDVMHLSEDEAIERGLMLNLARRHLSHEQKKEIIASLRAKGWSQERVARVVGLSDSRISQIENISISSTGIANNPAPPDVRYKLKREDKKRIKEAVDTGKTQEQIAADFGISQSRVSQIIKRPEPKREKPVSDGQAMITLQSYADFLENIHRDEADLLITDPPYMTEFKGEAAFAPFVYDWLSKAFVNLTKISRAFIFIGAYPSEIANYIDCIHAIHEAGHFDWLVFEDILVWTYKNTIGPRSAQTYIRNWQAILHLRGKDTPPLNNDSIMEQLAVHEFNAPDARHGERHYKFEKPLALAERLIRHATQPGAIVIDPFAGSGSFLLAAASLGCTAYGCDINEEAVKIAVERGCKFGF